MKIRWKVTLLLASLFAVLIAVEVVIQKFVILPSFAELERADVEVSMRRISVALDRAVEGLELTATDWADWGELYQFVQNRNHAFTDTYTTPVAMAPLKVNMLLIADLDGKIILSYARRLGDDAPIDLDIAKQQTLPDGLHARDDLDKAQPIYGLIRTNQGIMMIATSRALDGSGGGHALGTVVMGRLLTAAQLRAISEQAQVSLALTDPHPSGDQGAIVTTDSTTQIYRTFNDIYGKPLMTLRAQVPRSISDRGKLAVTYASAYLVGAAIVVLLLLLFILNRLVLAPIARVTRHAVAIGNDTDLTQRLNFKGSDEIARLAGEFDRMVEHVANTRRQLVDQSFQAGFAELAKGVLHNLGNAMTPFGVRLSALAERLRGMPVADIDQALAELLREGGDGARRTDLQEFIRLGNREIAAVVQDAQADIAVLQRQAQIMRAALADQMRSARNEQVVESVRLPELIAQSLEIVPDACRARLELQEDESLRNVGVVRVARTVLRLVLQNLIINAADAIRDAGREQGRLRIAAEIQRDGDEQQLHLHCADDGVGIASENLQRVFENGFSTKSSATNQGVGLHWCANAIGAMGGRIWAASDGPGLGASLHMVLPLA
jgi:two-component system NtrC family sensor kinase